MFHGCVFTYGTGTASSIYVVFTSNSQTLSILFLVSVYAKASTCLNADIILKSDMDQFLINLKVRLNDSSTKTPTLVVCLKNERYKKPRHYLKPENSPFMQLIRK